ncbi:hypothetical protein U9M48_015079 [Paspalum notatum var. saurae]|uniref:Cytokinin riboside 5'-monophosphate phosphoribohydrolase n=1 Tax=Paspalum notatum var. saurae TaxID=547442 RepID=A0AAQ3WLI7_PASNO
MEEGGAAENGGGKGASRFRRVCVFCGSSSGKRSSYRDAAVELGKELVARKVDLVYGGGSLGLMGEVSEAVHKGGGHVIGVIPTTLMGKEITGETVGEVRAVAGMHQRKAEMARNSDAFIALPGTYVAQQELPVEFRAGRPIHPSIHPSIHLLTRGYDMIRGYGTLDELLEVIAWAQLGIHSKPVGLLNVDGYYNFLLAFIDKAVDDGFIKPAQRHIFVSAPDARDLVQKLEEYEAVQDESDPATPKLRWEIEQVGYNASLQAEIAR